MAAKKGAGVLILGICKNLTGKRMEDLEGSLGSHLCRGSH